MISRVAVGIEIPTGFPYGWEFILAYGNSHMWESYGKSSFQHMGILWEIVNATCRNPMGNRHSHMWESYGNSAFPQKSCGNGDGNENSLPTATLILIDK